MRCEGAGIILVDIRLGAKKRDLKAERLAVLGGQPAGGIPPLRPELRVTAVIRGKYQRLTGGDRRIGGRPRGSPTSRRNPNPTKSHATNPPKPHRHDDSRHRN